MNNNKLNIGTKIVGILFLVELYVIVIKYNNNYNA